MSKAPRAESSTRRGLAAAASIVLLSGCPKPNAADRSANASTASLPSVGPSATTLPIDAGSGNAAGAGTAKPPAALEIRAETTPLPLAPLTSAAYADATAVASSDGAFLLYRDYDTFRVTERRPSGPGKVVAREKGMFARWVSPREVAFVLADRATKIDVTAPKTRVSGVKTCVERSVSFPCKSDRPAIVASYAPDLSQVIAIETMLEPRLAILSSAGLSPIFDGVDDLGRSTLAVAVSDQGMACAVRGQRAAGLVKVEPGSAAIETPYAVLCATAGSVPRAETFPLEPMPARDPHQVRLAFFSPSAVVVSLADGADARGQHRHCLIDLQRRDVRCTTTPRGEWRVVGDGRFVLEPNYPSPSAPAKLIDLAVGREWPLSDPALRGFWSSVSADAGDPKRLVLSRTDKSASAPYAAVRVPDR